MNIKDIYINVEKQGIKIGFIVLSKQEDGIVSSYMPGYDIYYSSPDMETAQKRGEAMVHNFFNFWIEKQSWKKFILKIHALGFRSKMHDLKMKNLLNQRPETADFCSHLDENASKVFSNGDNIKSTSNVLELVS